MNYSNNFILLQIITLVRVNMNNFFSLETDRYCSAQGFGDYAVVDSMVEVER